MTIGDMVVTLGMNITPFKQGAAQSESIAKRLGGSLSSIGTALSGMFAVGSLGALTSQAFESVDATAKLARTLGMTGSQLAGFQHAANLSGVEAGMFGEQLAKLNAKGGNLMDIARQMDAVRDPTERAKLAVGAFGEEGLKLLPVFAKGSSALQDMIKEGQRLYGISPIDERLIEQANGALTRMKASFMGIGATLATAAAPYIEFFANGVRSLIPSADALNVQFAFWGSLLRDSIPVIGGVAVAMMAIGTSQKVIATGQALILSLSGPSGWATLAIGAGIAASAYLGIGSALDGIAESARNSAAQVATMTPAVQQMATGTADLMQKVGGATVDIKGKLADLNNELEVMRAPEGLREMVRQRQEIQKLFSGATTSEEISQVNQIRALMDERRKLQAMQQESDSLASRMKGKLDSLKSPFDKWKEDLQEIEQALSKGIVTPDQASQLKADLFAQVKKEEDGNAVSPGLSGPANQGAAVATQGSTEAYRLITSAMNAQKDAQDQFARKQMEKQTKQGDQMVALLQKLAGEKPAKTEEVEIRT